MDGLRFDAWTRRQIGLATGGFLAALLALLGVPLLGLLGPEEADANRRHKRKRRRRKKRRRRRRRRQRQRKKDQDQEPSDRPDIILINVDDMRESDYQALTRTRQLLGQQGATYPNFFLTTPLCAPSRAILFRGQYAHNTGVRNNQDGYGVFKSIDESTIATWLRGATPSYRTAHIGKHMNGYGFARNHVGPGWSDWIVPAPVRYYDYDLNINGEREPHGNAGRHYLTDVLAEKARAVISTTPAATPLFLYFAPKAPHGPSTPANRHKGDFNGVAFDTENKPSFNEEDMTDKPAYMQRDPLSQADIDAVKESDQLRLESLLAVDEAIASLVETLDAAGRLANAYLFFVTDNGYLLGEHRRTSKGVPYEEAIRMSMLVRGPSIGAGQTIEAMVANIDLAPTIAELAGVTPPGFVDGRSIVETFDGSGNDRQALLIELFPPPRGAQEDPEESPEQFPAERRLLEVQAEPDTARRAIRTEDWLYVQNGAETPELYDLQNDPFQIQSLHEDPGQSGRIAELSAWLDTLKDCSAGSCRAAENAPPA